MKQINPLYLLLFFVLALVLMVYKVVQTESKMQESIQNAARYEADGKQIEQLKNRWKDSAVMQKRVQTLLSHKPFSAYVTKNEPHKNGYKVQLEGLDNTTLDTFVNKLLNEAIALKSFEISRLSESNATVVVECAW
ncbi:MAG: hypothetical protein JXK05_05105 [Campylobacterales bacterium]|nr:hypothetical protein [Campylobacterales bacterium]